MGSDKKYLWAEMTWPELRQVAQENYVVVVPVGAIEQHGAHLPVDVDVRLPFELATRAAQVTDGVLVAPSIWSGLSPEHHRFPGTIYLRLETMVYLVSDVLHCIASYGFHKIVLLNGHGGNTAPLRAIAKDFLRTHGLSVACADHWVFAAKEIQQVRRSAAGGIGHACEMETSLYLHYHPELVQMDLAAAAYEDPVRKGLTSFVWKDMFEPGMVWMTRDYGIHDPLGLVGDATVATPETGKAIFEAELEHFTAFLREFREAQPVLPSPVVDKVV